MAMPVLATKLFVPPARPETVGRARLVERLQSGLESGGRLSLVSAPAGFGKTTLVSEWLAEAARRDPEVHRAWLRDTTVAPPGGESFADAEARVATARETIVAEHAGQTVVLVTHVTPIKSMIRAAMRVGPELLHGLHLDLASVSLVEYFDDGGSVGRLVNDTSHLRSYPLG